MKSLLILGASALSLAMASNLIDDPTRYPSVPDYGPQVCIYEYVYIHIHTA